ncbi:NmrA/HSCARG family protein [Tengunoibacter tsumagoiensis]|uniref:NmrA-like domain-containing protein n=1 Tax=Tengunoibacter tsumagoiensis TaxID=2014871 RepID=A0A402A2U0_9CHLR|nr:NmrA/HSCARG family protein [Tengunoibacter tsumagoiensis]GCE13468.1 hypothetical protein KTT_33270 [Tengunoibacter tsumagoiensis]
METRGKTILVTGATGNQGGAVTCHLLMDGWKVRALARDPQKPAYQALKKAGVELVRGDLDNIASLDEALTGVYGVFSVQNYIEHGPAGEVIQGKSLADAAKNAHVAHFVYSSVGGADRHSAIPHFESKWEVEQHIRTLGLPMTILRPVFFMDNFTSMYGQSIEQGVLTMPLKPTTKVQVIAADDIGAFAALALKEPQKFLGKAIELAGDELTMPQVAETFTRVFNHPVRYVEQPLEQVMSSNEEIGVMMEWFNTHGYQADISSLRQLYPPLLTLEAWLRKGAGHQ